MKGIAFESADWLYLLFGLIPFIIWYIYKESRSSATIRISYTGQFEYIKKTYKYYLRHFPFVLRVLALMFLILALARPQSENSWQDITTEGIDMVLALDISGSMLAQDFKPDRLEAAKNVAIKFINGRPNDRIGLVVFSGEAFTQCPVTIDHAVLINLFKDVKSGMIEDGTAIGLGLGTAINRLKDSKSKSKVIILLTDGVNNTGEIAPLTASDMAKTYGIRVYTIGVGSIGTAPYPVQTPFGTQYQNMEVKIDEAVLKQIANSTGGDYFRATDNTSLEKIYEKIDTLEKSKIDVKHFSKKKEEYMRFAIAAALLLLLEIVLRNTLLKSIP